MRPDPQRNGVWRRGPMMAAGPLEETGAHAWPCAHSKDRASQGTESVRTLTPDTSLQTGRTVCESSEPLACGGSALICYSSPGGWRQEEEWGSEPACGPHLAPCVLCVTPMSCSPSVKGTVTANSARTCWMGRSDTMTCGVDWGLATTSLCSPDRWCLQRWETAPTSPLPARLPLPVSA